MFPLCQNREVLDHDAIRGRIKARIEKLELPATGLWLKEHGIGQTTVRNFLDGTNKSLTLETVNKLADPLKTTEQWLLFGDDEPVSEDALREMAETAVEEIQVGMRIEEIRNAVASALHAQLALHRVGGEVRSFAAERIARDTAARSPVPTSSGVRAKSRTA